MAAVMSPILVGVASFKTGGVVNSGGLLYTYLAGTTTPAATYPDSTLSGANVNANPMVFNSLGLLSTEIWWAAGTYLKFIVKDSAGNTLATYDNLVGINDGAGTTATEWTTLALTPTYISATSFSVTGNQTTTLQVGRRLKTINTAGTAYSTLFSSTFAAGITTVVVVNTLLALDAGLSAVSYGLLAATNPSLPTIDSYTDMATPDFFADSLWIYQSSTKTMQKVSPVRIGGLDVIATELSVGGSPITLFTGVNLKVYRQIIVTSNGVSLNGTDDILFQIGSPAGYAGTVYGSAGSIVGNAIATVVRTSTTGFIVPVGNAAFGVNGTFTFTRMEGLVSPGGDIWFVTGNCTLVGAGTLVTVGGQGTLVAATPRSVLDRMQITATGANSTDAGTVSVYGRV